MTPLRAAVIGCGRIGSSTRPELRASLPKGWLPINHAEAIRASAGLALEAMCDVDAAAVERACREHGVDGRYTDYRVMIRDVAPEVLGVATRTRGRCEILRYAAEHGVRGVHLEKPASNSLEECRLALAAVRRHGVHLTYGTVRRFMDAYRKAREMLDAGVIGALRQVCVEMGRAPLLWSHPHSVDLMLFFTGAGSFEYVQGNCAIEAGPSRDGLRLEEDPLVNSALVQFPGGITGLITARGGCNVALCGAEGTLIVVADGSWIEVQRRGKRGPYFLEISRVEIEPELGGTARAFGELERSIRGGGATSITAAEIELGQEILLAIAYSTLHGGRRVQAGELPAAFTVLGRSGENYA